MALDPSLFMQGAQLRQQNARDQQAIVGNFFDRLTQQQQYDEKRKLLEREMAMKEAEAARKAAIPDIEPLAQVGLFKMQSGQEPTGQEAAAIRTYFLLKPPSAGYNPVTGRMEAGPSPLDSLGLKPIAMGSQPSAPPQAIGMGANDIQTQEIPPIDESQLMAGAPKGISLDGPAPVPNVMKMLQPDQGYVPPEPARPVQSLQDKSAYESQLKVAEEEAKAGIEAKKSGEKARTEEEIKTEIKNKGISDLVTNIDKLIKDASGTPSGEIEGFKASATEFIGKPNKQAIARANFASGKAISGLQSRIAFLKGQGTITDAEAKTAMAFLPEPNDAYEIKISKLEGAKNYIQGLMGKTGNETPKPRRRYNPETGMVE